MSSPNANSRNAYSRPQYTPDRIDYLADDEVFVFGSNPAGRHDGGAALMALRSFGAVYGQGSGLHGRSYAIPTIGLQVGEIRHHVDEFIRFASSHGNLFFYVTRIGCGGAGFKDSEIAPLFYEAYPLGNVILPATFSSHLSRMWKATTFPTIPRPQSIRLEQNGQVRTLADIAKALNDESHYTGIDEFLRDFEDTVRSYKARGTVSREVCSAIGRIIHDNGAVLFQDGHLDFGKFMALVDGLSDPGDDNPLEAIYSRREKTKILRFAALLNDIVRYTSPSDLHDDLIGLCTGRHNCGDNRYMNDSFGYPLHFFERGLNLFWDSIRKDGVMDNDLLEEKMFTEHEKKVIGKGLDRVMEEDFRSDAPSHPEVFFPKREGTAPVYVLDPSHLGLDGKPSLTKSCGDGKGPNSVSLRYEMQILRKIVQRECDRGRYERVGECFIPVGDDSRPILHSNGVFRFDNPAHKQVYLKVLREKALKNSGNS